jgi:hypothetical protein
MWKKHDPIKIQAARLDETDKLSIETDIEAEISQAYETALHDPFPVLDC